ncbi:MAG: hypothetical protein AAGA80_21515 [Cyanobacteria bacterium P01_F01_bin.143]
MRTFIQRPLVSFIIGIFSSLVATLIIECLWGFPSGLFRKPISFYLIDQRGNPVKENIKAYLTVYPPMTKDKTTIFLNLDKFPNNHRTFLHIESDEDDSPLIDYPISLNLHDLTRPIRIVITEKSSSSDD